MNRFACILLGLCLAIGPVRLVAGDIDTPVAKEILVSEKKIRRTPTSVDIIDTEEAAGAMSSLPDLLADRVGVQIKRYGGLGSYSVVSIRGSNVNQVMVYMDGIPLNDSVFGEVNLENFPVENLEQIEIYRGFTPLRFGISGIGGVINLVTRKAPDHTDNYASAAYGSYETSKITLSRSQRLTDFSYLVFLNRTGSRGDFRFLDDNGTPVINTDDDRWVKRENNQHTSYSATAKASYNLGVAEISLLNDFFSKNQGLPGLNNNSVQYASLDTKRNLLNLGITIPALFIKGLKQEINLYHALRRDIFDDSFNEIGLGSAKQTGLFQTIGARAVTEWEIKSIGQTLTLLMLPQRETYRSRIDTAASTEKNPEEKRDRINFGLEDNLLLFGERLQITGQIRQDRWKDSFRLENTPWQTGSGVREERENRITDLQGGMHLYLYRKALYLKGSLGHSHRIPSFTELFGDRGVTQGNPELKPERSLNRDAGGGMHFEAIAEGFDEILLEYVYFNNRVTDIISLIPNSQMTMKAQNISAAEISGHEVSLSLGFFRHVSLRGNYTYQRAMDRGDIPYYRGKYLPYRPLHEGAGSITLFNRHASVSYEISYMGANFRDRANSDFYYVRQRTYHNLLLLLIPYQGIKAKFEIKNLTDDRTRDVIGYPLPGRSYYGSLACHF